MPVINNVVYVNGRRAAEPAGLDQTLAALEETGGVAWLALYDPDPAELQVLAAQFSLHRLAVEDALTGHQRSKLERYGDVMFVVLRPAAVAGQDVVTGELHMFIGPNFVVTIRHDAYPDLAGVRARLERQPEELGLGTMAIVHAILDQVVDEFSPVVHHLSEAIEDAEEDLFTSEPDVSLRIYGLMRDVVAIQHAIQPIEGFVEQFSAASELDPHAAELQAHFRDVSDHVLTTAGQMGTFRDLLTSALQLHIALVGQQQNVEMARLAEEAFGSGEQAKKVSAWAAILFTPTVIAGIYGMNFSVMPELDWYFGYPFAIGIMFTAALVLYIAFKRNRWL